MRAKYTHHMGATGMTTEPTVPERAAVQIADYDSENYDYRQFWRGRDYEHWAEARVIRRLFARIPRAEWLVDLGGGFGRNVPQYKTHADHTVLVDYSWTNLTHAEAALLRDGEDGTLFLVRANLYRMPFRDGAFDLGMTTRVIHHLKAIDDALAEMGRILGRNWMLDVPIKTHLLARARGLSRGRLLLGRDRRPNDIGTPDTPFFNFHLGAIRARLGQLGWSSAKLASVNNFRRWERAVPGPLTRPARPLVQVLEMAAQSLGRGWWGPAQFLWLTRAAPLAMTTPAIVHGSAPPRPWDQLAPRMCCPTCHGELRWSTTQADCTACQSSYGRTGAIWDFVVA